MVFSGCNFLTVGKMLKVENVYDIYRHAQEEQIVARKYILNKKLSRPKTNCFTVFLIITSCLLSGTLAAWGVIWALNTAIPKVYVYITCYVISFRIFFKQICLKSIECYQHYASEKIRRSCLCMPTCSEYAIAVLKKYPILIALIKIEKRLFKTCRGNFYKIDLP